MSNAATKLLTVNNPTATDALITRFPLTGSLTPSQNDITPSLQQSSGSFVGSGSSAYYLIDSRTTSSNRLYWTFNFSGTGVNNRDHFRVEFEYYWDAGDNFKTTFAWTKADNSGANGHFRTNRSVSGGQSGRWLGVNSPTASSTWNTPSSTWIRVIGHYNIANSSGYLKVGGTKEIEVPGDGTFDQQTPGTAEIFTWGQFTHVASSDNGIRMRLGVIQLSAWDGNESAAPAFNGRFT